MDVDSHDDDGCHANKIVSKTTIHCLPDNCLELIFTHVNPNEDFNSIKQVSRRWNRLSLDTLRRMKRLFHKCINFSWRFVEADHLLSERCSHAVCFHPSECAVYMFGGCNNTYTAFNDLWLFDMNTHEWERVLITRAPLPSPKALATLVLYKENLLLFGGFSKSSMNPIHQTSTFYNELHLYNAKINGWEELISENTGPHLAGHTASIVGDFMLVFGGSMGSSYNNNVYVLDLVRRIWNMPSIPGPCPPPRYGQSQVLLDDRHLIIIGGCGGPSVNFADVWMLDFDLSGDAEWRWTQIKVDNPELTPPYMWCYQACKVGQNAVIVSRPVKQDKMRPGTNNRRGIHRRRTSSQSTTSSAGGSGRLTSPDSPSDRRAVAAAFCSSASSEQLHQQVQRKRGNLQRDGKPILLTSRSLDDQEHKNNGIAASSSFTDLKNNATNLSATHAHCSGGYLNAHNSSQKGVELHRACSIPAIIVGEIPKLIVTSSAESSTNHRTNNQQRKGIHNKKSEEACSSSSPNFDTKIKDERLGTSNPSQSISGQDAVRDYYVSLVKEEYDRIHIVEMEENLGNINQKLDKYLSACIPYLTKQERTDIVEEVVNNNSAAVDEKDSMSTGEVSHERGSIRDLRNRRQGQEVYVGESGDNMEEGSSGTASERQANPPLLISGAFGPFYGRQMCVFVLRLGNVVTERRVSWEQLPVEEDAPEDRLLHSLVAGRGELVLFGGMYSDGFGMDCLNVVHNERYTMSSETYILRPRYNEM